MVSKFRFISKTCMAACLSTAIFSAATAEACTRFVYTGKDNQVLTGRSMDWKDDIKTDLWVFPRGMKRNGATGANTIHWTSKYGSVVASALNLATSDGMNEAGLSAGILWLAESEYPHPAKKRTLSVAAWTQYILDNYATVREAVEALKKEPFIPVSGKLPNSNLAAGLHLALSDPSGNSAVIEYVNGKQKIYHGSQYNVMTNSPVYNQQLAINSYWQDVGGMAMLPGSNRPSDRFVRASFFTKATNKTTDPAQTLATVFGIIRNSSVPYGISTPDRPDISSTRWRSISDQKNKRYYFESAFSQSAFFVDLPKLDFSKKSGKVMKLSLGENEAHPYYGQVNDQFKKAEPFEFYGFSAR